MEGKVQWRILLNTVMKRREFNDQLSDYHILENDSAP
jgi:hypothetical protein